MTNQSEASESARALPPDRREGGAEWQGYEWVALSVTPSRRVF